MSYRFNKSSSNSRRPSNRNGRRNPNNRINERSNKTEYNSYDSRGARVRDEKKNWNQNPNPRNFTRSRDNNYSRNNGSSHSSFTRNRDKLDLSLNAEQREQNQRHSSSQFNQNLSRESRSEVLDSHRSARELEQGDVVSNSYLEDSPSDLLWGRHSTQAAFETGRPIHRIWCTAELRSSTRFFQYLRDAKSSGVLVEEVSWARLGQVTKGAVHQGIALQTSASETIDLKKLIDACSSLKDSALLLALDGITDPHNLGAIIRTAEALGAHGLVLPQRRSAGLTGSVAKVAAGALEHLPVARVVNLNRSLSQLKDFGYKVIGLAEEGETTINQVEFDGPLVVVIGSENKGLSVLTRRYCDQLVRIPLRGVTTSLNASIATSVVLYEIAKNTWMKGISGQSPSPKLQRAKFISDENLK